MSITYQTCQGEILDDICWKRYGQTGRLEQTALLIDPDNLEFIKKSGMELSAFLGPEQSTGMEKIVETVLETNPGLVDYGPVLPAGVTIILPDISPDLPETKGERLWD